MVRTTVLFIAAVAFSLSGLSMQDDHAPARTRLGHHTRNVSNCGPLVGLPNPAATFCQKNGGEYQIRRTDGGDVGVCRFAATKTECGGKAFQDGQCAPGTCREWSAAQNVCAVLVTAAPGCGQAVEAQSAGACDEACHANDTTTVMPTKDVCACGAACACANNDCTCADDCACAKCNDCGGNASQVTTTEIAVEAISEATHARCECGSACARANEGPCADLCSCASCNIITEPAQVTEPIRQDGCLCKAACSCPTTPPNTPVVGGGCSE